MMVMPSNNSSPLVHYLSGRFPHNIGWLLGPSGFVKSKLRDWMPFALDNDAFSCWSKGLVWNEAAWIAMLDILKHDIKYSPRWVLVPDVVADRKATLEKWGEYSPKAATFGWPLAFAVQDGMSQEDVPEDASVVFVGGTTQWKWDTLPDWCSFASEQGRTVHVGRVNSVDKLDICHKLGVASVDGTGWVRATEDGRQATGLRRWLEKLNQVSEAETTPNQDWI